MRAGGLTRGEGGLAANANVEADMVRIRNDLHDSFPK